MPTGYTAKIEEGQAFEDFVMNCARAFGALIELRDAPNAKIPKEFKPSSYHEKELKRLKKELAKVEAWSEAKAENEAFKDYEERADAWDKLKEVNARRKSRYLEMLEKVNTWQPPTAEHVNLKIFMKEQIESSIKFDCHVEYCPDLIQHPGEVYKKKTLNRLLSDIDYHEKEHENEVKRAQGNTAWVTTLRQSLRK